MTKVLKRIAIIVTFAFAIISTTNAMKAGGALALETVQAATMNYYNGGGAVYGVPGRHGGKPWFLFHVTGGGANMEPKLSVVTLLKALPMVLGLEYIIAQDLAMP